MSPNLLCYQIKREFLIRSHHPTESIEVVHRRENLGSTVEDKDGSVRTDLSLFLCRFLECGKKISIPALHGV